MRGWLLSMGMIPYSPYERMTSSLDVIKVKKSKFKTNISRRSHV
jgi:hypothetical protein